jgi:hypothetical protein
MHGNQFLTVQVDYVAIASVILCILPAILTVAVILREARQRQAERKHPFKELKRRPAGESLRLKIESLDESIDDRVMQLVAGPIVLAGTAVTTRLHGLIACLLLLTISLIWTLSLKNGLSRLLKERKDYRLGFDGERYVGEELSRLIVHGFEIYHDVPFDCFNMDHVLVGKQGVFVVETKTRSKPVNKAGDKEFRVLFNGSALRWPWGEEQKDVEQARNNAATLSIWLTKAVGQSVKVSSILTLPGWWIERSVPSNDLHVLNPKEITRINDLKSVFLDQEMVRRICYQLDQKCRMGVE